jgi:hypothetical protein
MPDPDFNRVFATARVLESICQHCMRTVGVSSAPHILSIVEHAHICPATKPLARTSAATST